MTHSAWSSVRVARFSAACVSDLFALTFSGTMNFDVFTQMITSHESSVAQRAGELFLACVRPEVTLQFIGTRETLPAKKPVAHERALTRVPSEMCFQVRYLAVHFTAAGHVAVVQLLLLEVFPSRPQFLDLLAVRAFAAGLSDYTASIRVQSGFRLVRGGRRDLTLTHVGSKCGGMVKPWWRLHQSCCLVSAGYVMLTNIRPGEIRFRSGVYKGVKGWVSSTSLAVVMKMGIGELLTKTLFPATDSRSWFAEPIIGRFMKLQPCWLTKFDVLVNMRLKAWCLLVKWELL